MYRLKSPPNLNDLLDEYEDLPGHNVCDKSNYESRNELDVSFINPEVKLRFNNILMSLKHHL